MEQYYNHVTNRLEKLEPYMAKNLPKSKEEYENREAARKSLETFCRGKVECTKTPEECYPTIGDEVFIPEIEGIDRPMIYDRDLKRVSLEEFNDPNRKRQKGEYYEEVGTWEGVKSLLETWNKLGQELKKEEVVYEVFIPEIDNAKVTVATINPNGLVEYPDGKYEVLDGILEEEMITASNLFMREGITYNFADDVDGIENCEVVSPTVNKTGKAFAWFLLTTFAILAATVLYNIIK